MIIVTGGAGFIGSNLIGELNRRGFASILLVDNLENVDKIPNLNGLKINDFMDKDEFYSRMLDGTEFGNVEAVFHQGACSDTMASDGRYVLHNNFTYSKEVMEFCGRNGSPFIYASSASVYGAGQVFVESEDNESALNAYAWSKLLFDRYVRSRGTLDFQVCGLRYFNVYGPGENHKGRMASVAYHFNNQYRQDGAVRLFAGSGGYEDGGQLRDFVFVDDVVDVNMYLLENPGVSGIFNAGTGRAESFNRVALSVINHIRSESGEAAVDLSQAVNSGAIQYIPMPEALVGKYQSFTQADLNNLRGTGYAGEFHDVAAGVGKYLKRMDDD